MHGFVAGLRRYAAAEMLLSAWLVSLSTGELAARKEPLPLRRHNRITRTREEKRR